MCTAEQINSNVKELQELRRMKEELDAEITAIEDRLKQHMHDTGVYVIDAITARSPGWRAPATVSTLPP